MSQLAQGSQIGGYRVLRLLGEGGMGIVFEVVNEAIERKAAIKVLKAPYSRDQEILGRFFNEARAVNIIRHPGIVAISEFGALPDGAAYIVMEYLEGESLRARLQRGAVPSQALRIARQIASALSAAHAKNIIHRDLKPDNVMLVPDDDMPGRERVKVLDFGIAKLAEVHRRPGVGIQRTTRLGMRLGTPTYMAPEQCTGDHPVTDRADVYALGVVLYHMLSGHPPFRAPMPEAVMVMHVTEEPTPIGALVPGLASAVATFVHKMMAKDPRRRPSMKEVTARLDQLGAQSGTLPIQDGPVPPDAPPGAPPPGWVPPRPAARRGTTPSSPTALMPPATERIVEEEAPQGSTLRSAASESISLRRPRRLGEPRRMVLLLAAVTAGSAATALCVLFVLRALLWNEPQRSPWPPLSTLPPSQVAEGTKLTPAGAADLAPPPAPDLAPPPVSAGQLVIRARPGRAQILVEGVLCENPCMRRVPAGTRVQVTVRRRGYLSYERQIFVESDAEMEVELKRVERTPKPEPEPEESEDQVPKELPQSKPAVKDSLRNPFGPKR